MSFHLFLRSGYFSICILTLAIQIAAAQGNPVNQPKNLEQSGTLKGIRPPFLNLDVDGKNWIIKVMVPQDKMRYQATAELNWLKAGMVVQYDNADEKGGSSEPVKKLIVFTPSPEFRPGVYDEGDGSFLVMGQIKSVRNNRMTVITGRKPSRVKVADDVEIQVKLSHVNFMQIGDLVKISGSFYQEGKGVADKLLEVTASKKLMGKTKKRRKRRTKSKT